MDSKLSCSMRIVLNDDDLLTLILLHVPWKTLMSSKCVSRQWLSLINAPHFISLRNLRPLRASGVFLQDLHRYGENNKVYFVHLDYPNTPSPCSWSQAFAHDPSDIRIVQSCNGLLLYSSGNIDERNYYVYNPSTNQLITLPKHPCHKSVGAPRMALSFDPSKSLHYKVICFLARRCDPAFGDSFIYSSETGNWRVFIQSYCPSPNMWFLNGVYWNGSMHWLSQYDSRPVSDCLCFNVDEESLQTFPSPPISRRSGVSHSYFGESEGHLHYTEVRPYESSFSVYEMKSDYSEWFVKYQIDLVPISIVFPQTKRSFHYFKVAVVSVIRRENFKEDSFLVLELPGKIIRYNLVDRSFNVIWDFFEDLKVHYRHGSHWVCGNFKAWPYFEIHGRAFATVVDRSTVLWNEKVDQHKL